MIPAAAVLHGHYSGIQLPVTIVAGAGDRIVDPWQHARRLHREVPHSHILLLQGLGHMVHHAAVGLVTAAVETIAKQSERPYVEVENTPVSSNVAVTKEVLEPDSPGG